MKKILGLFALLIVSFVFAGCELFGNLSKDADFANAYITIDINPSIEIITGDKGKVISVNALNEDAQVLLIDVDFTNMSVDEVIDSIMSLALELGYIIDTEENAILITTQGETDEATSRIKGKVSQVVNKFKEKKQIRMQLLHAEQHANEELRAQAKALNISVGKLKLINTVLQFTEDLTLEEASKMPVKDLNQIIIDARKEMKDFISPIAQKEFLNLKKRMHQELSFKKVELISQILINADDSLFTEILAGTSTTVEEIKTLYTNYYEELKTAKSNFDYNSIITEIMNCEEINALIAQYKALFQTELSIREQLVNDRFNKELKTQLRDILIDMHSIKQQLRDEVQGILQSYGIDIRLEWGFLNGEFTIQIKYEGRNGLNDIKAKYEALFLDKGIDLEALEEIFTEQIVQKIQELREEYQEQLEVLKENAQNMKQEIKEQFKSHKEALKESHHNRKGHK